MQNNDRSFWALALIFMFVGASVMLGAMLAGCSRTDTGKANRAAHEYIHNIPHATSVECANTDTDGDGYLSCTVFRDGDLDPLPIECGSEKWCIWNCAEGCKYNPIGKVR